MRRILTNWLLLMTIATATPDGRNKRHLSYIKNFIISTFYGDDQTPTSQILEPELQYELFRIPGFNDILIKTLKCSSDELTIVNKSGGEMEIKPFESYIGTKSIKETDVAFRNVYKLLSTRILNQPERSILQNVMVPIVNGLHYESGENRKRFRVNSNTIQPVIIKQGEVKSFSSQNSDNFQDEKNIQSFSFISESVQPQRVDEVHINEFNNNLQVPFETIYSPQPLQKNEPVMSFTLKSYPEVTEEQNIGSSPNLPRFIKRKLHKGVSLGTNPYRTPNREDQGNIYRVNQYIPSESEHFRNKIGPKLVPLNSLVLPSVYFEEPVHIDVVNTDKHTLDVNNILKSLGPTATPNDFLINADLTKEYEYNKSNSSKVINTDKTNNNVYNAPKDNIIPPVNHTHSNKFEVVKEKDEISIQLPFHINYVDIPPVKNIAAITKTKQLNIKTTDDNSATTEDKNNGSNVVKTSDNWSKNETLSQYIYDHVGHNKPHTVSILKEKDEQYAPYVTDRNDINIQDKKDMRPIKTADSITREESLSQYIYKHTNPHTFGKEKLSEKSKTSIDNNSLLYIQPYDSPIINIVQPDDGVGKNNDDHVNVVKTNESHLIIVHTKGSDKNVEKSNNSHVNIVHTNDSDKNIVKSNDSPVNIVHTNESDKNVVKSNYSHVNIIHTNDRDKIVVKSNDSHVNIVHTNDSGKNVIKSNDSHVNIVHTNHSDKNVVKNNDSHVNIVHTNDSGKNVVKSNDSHVNIIHTNDRDKNVVKSNDSHVNIVHTNDSVSDKNIVKNVNVVKINATLEKNVDEVPDGVNLSQLPNKQISYKISNKPNNLESENQVTTNVYTNSPLPQEDSSISPIIDKDPNAKNITTDNKFSLVLDGNEVKINAISNTPLFNYDDHVLPITNSPQVNYTIDKIGDDKEIAANISSTELPQNNGSSLITENENQDRDSDNVSGAFTRGRGDIPGQ